MLALLLAVRFVFVSPLSFHTQRCVCVCVCVRPYTSVRGDRSAVAIPAIPTAVDSVVVFNLRYSIVVFIIILAFEELSFFIFIFK